MKKNLIALIALAIMSITTAVHASSADQTLVDRAARKLSEFGVTNFDKKSVIFLNSKEETTEKFANHPDLQKVLKAVAFSSPGVNVIYINTWEPTLWRNIADPRIADPAAREAAAVVAASLLAHEMAHISFGVNELIPHQTELEVLLFFQKKRVQYLDIPIAETRKAIEDAKKKDENKAGRYSRTALFMLV